MTTLLPHLSKAPKAAKLWTIAAAMFFLLEGVSSHTDFVARPKLLFKRGTATVIKVDADRVIIASDSRVTLPTGYRDDDCKIFALSHAVVFSGAGYRNISSAQPAGTWDSHDIARESFALTQSKHMERFTIMSGSLRRSRPLSKSLAKSCIHRLCWLLA